MGLILMHLIMSPQEAPFSVTALCDIQLYCHRKESPQILLVIVAFNA